MASLLIVKGADTGRRVVIEADRVVLGRDPGCDVVILGTAVSRRHAVISRLQGKYYIEDGDGKAERSRNGTNVNNDPVPFPGRVLLKDEDTIKICDFVCSFHDGPVKKPLPAEMLREEPEPPDEPPASTTVEAALSSFANRVLLETQPAEKIKLLLDILSSLSKNLKVDTLLPEIANKLFEIFRQADRCFIILRDETTSKLIPKVIRTRRKLDETQARFSKQIANRCLETSKAFLSEDASSDNRFVLSQSIADFRIRSVMCAPLVTQDDRAFGVIQLDTQDRNKRFTHEGDLSLLMGVASQASIALVNAKLHEDQVANERYQSEMELARDVQQKFLPATTPALPNYEFFAHYDAAQRVGGDYYDFIPVIPSRLAIMLGDVAGKGMPAALLMAKLSSDVRFCMLTEQDAATAFRKLNSLMHQSGLTDRFVTLVAAVLDPLEHHVTFVNAGSMCPLVYRRATGQCQDAMDPEAGGVPLAVHDEYPYESSRIQLEAGDSILLFSDGVTDAMDVHNCQFHLKGVCATLQGDRLAPGELGRRLVEAIARHSVGQSQHDDITLVCFGRLD